MSVGRVTVRIAPALRAALAERDAEALLAAVHEADSHEVLTRSRTTDTSVVEVAGLGRTVRKRWRWPGLGERLRGVGRTTALAPTPAEREWTALGRTYGDPPLRFHPAPLAVRVERRRGLATRAMLLLEEVPDAVDLATWLRDERDAATRRAVLADLARRVRALHAAGVSDGDLHPRNLLVEPAVRRVWDVDCARARRRSAPLVGRQADHDLACVDVGLSRFASRTERLRAFRTYLGSDADREATRAHLARIAVLRRRLEPEESPRLPAPHRG